MRGRRLTRLLEVNSQAIKNPLRAGFKCSKRYTAYCYRDGAQKKTRTSTPLRALAPEASVSTNSTTWALKAMHLHSFHGTTTIALRCGRELYGR